MVNLMDQFNEIGQNIKDIIEPFVNLPIDKCRLCDLKGRDYAFPRIVRGKGPKVMIIGEAPGREEARYHLSFIGRSGKELDRWIEYMHLTNYYITNVVKHRPVEMDKDRPPTEEEIGSCITYLVKEIITEKPDLILTLGNPASHALGSTLPISKSIDVYLHEPHYYRDSNIRVLSLFHPSYVLRKKNEQGYEEFTARLLYYLDSIRAIIDGMEE